MEPKQYCILRQMNGARESYEFWCGGLGWLSATTVGVAMEAFDGVSAYALLRALGASDSRYECGLVGLHDARAQSAGLSWARRLEVLAEIRAAHPSSERVLGNLDVVMQMLGTEPLPATPLPAKGGNGSRDGSEEKRSPYGSILDLVVAERVVFAASTNRDWLPEFLRRVYYLADLPAWGAPDNGRITFINRPGAGRTTDLLSADFFGFTEACTLADSLGLFVVPALIAWAAAQRLPSEGRYVHAVEWQPEWRQQLQYPTPSHPLDAIPPVSEEVGPAALLGDDA